VAALRAAVGVPFDRRPEIDALDVGERGEPGEHVAELVLEVRPVAGAHRLGELADFLDQPPEGDIATAIGIAPAVDGVHRGLELVDPHGLRSLVARCGRSIRA
jgi:hypothetical protein